MAPFNRSHTSSYSSSIVTMAISSTKTIKTGFEVSVYLCVTRLQWLWQVHKYTEWIITEYHNDGSSFLACNSKIA